MPQGSFNPKKFDLSPEADTAKPIYTAPMNDNLLRLPAVMRKTAISKGMVYKLVQDGRFPAPYKPTDNISVWKESEINEWIAALKRGE